MHAEPTQNPYQSPVHVASPLAQQLAEMGVQFDPRIHYRLDWMFPKREGWGIAGHIKKKAKQIRRIEGRLVRLLRPGEEVLYISHGVQNKFVEQMFMGWMSMLINQTVFVLTNLRLVLLHTDTFSNPKYTYWTIYYSQIEQFKPSWTGQVQIKLKDGTALKFTGFPKLDRKAMPQVFEQALAGYRGANFNPQVTQSRENVCSHCCQVVPKDVYRCPQCGAEFWAPRDVALRSLVFPSWGDFLMRHTVPATMELVGYLFSWGFLALFVLVALAGGRPEEALGFGAVLLFVIGMQHCIDATLTYFIAKKGLHPKVRPVE